MTFTPPLDDGLAYGDRRVEPDLKYRERIRRRFRYWRYDGWNVHPEMELPHWLWCGCDEPLRHLLIEEPP